MKICVAIVTNRHIKPQTVLSLMKMLGNSGYETYPVVATEGYTIAEGRNYCVYQAKKNNCTHILFIDDDMVFPADTVERLLAHGKEIVGVYSYSRSLPLIPTVAFLDENGEHLPHTKIAQFKRPDELFKVYTVGMGVCLVEMNVFELVDQPWFSFTTHESGKVVMGEDAYFCTQARHAGIDIWCDPTLSIGHVGDYVYQGEDLLANEPTTA